MADLVFNVAKGRAAHYASLPAANDALIVVPLEAAGLEADATLADHDTLTALLVGASNEQATMGRKTLAGVTVTVDDANDRVDVDASDIVWAAAAGAEVGALVVCYDPDAGAGDDTSLIPLTKHDFSVVPSGGDVTAQLAAAGFYRAS